MKYLPKNTLTGNLHKASVKEFTLQSGTTGVNFTMVTQRVWKDKEGNKKEEEPFFHNCTAFGRDAEIIKAAAEQEGLKISFEPSFRREEWEKEGVKHYATKVTARWIKAYKWDGSEWVEQELVALSAESSAANEGSEDLPF